MHERTDICNEIAVTRSNFRLTCFISLIYSFCEPPLKIKSKIRRKRRLNTGAMFSSHNGADSNEAVTQEILVT